MTNFLKGSLLLKMILGIGVFLHSPAIHAMNASHQEGMSLAKNIPMPQPGSPEKVPGFAGTDLPQSQIKAHDLGAAAGSAAQSDEATKLIGESFEKREKFVIDPHTDPLIVAGNKVIANPESTLGEDTIEAEGAQDTSEEIKICEEGGEEYTQKCSKYLEIVLKVTPEKSTSSRYCPGHAKKERKGWSMHYSHWTEYCSGCATSVTVIPKKVDLVSERWVDGCAVLEDLAEKGVCRYISKTTSQKDETRAIGGEPVKRDHFEEHFEYACFKTSQKSCAGLREKGCYQVKSVCKEEILGRCVLWEQTYKCPSKKLFGKSYRSSNTDSSGKDSSFCLSGDCADTSYTSNSDFGQVMSQMSVLKEAGDDLRKLGAIFKGQDRRCTRHCLDFKDCCGNGNGWGVSLNLASCDADEKELAELRTKNRCIQVGTYCAERLPVVNTCVRKKTTFCCYGTKLAKIIQEQGKRQLGLGFGSPEQPQCQGLSAEQLSKIDFSKIDFSDVLQDVVSSTKALKPQDITQGIQKSMANKGSLLEGNLPEGNLLKIKEKESPKSLPPVQAQALTKNQPTTHEIQGRTHGQF